MDDKALIALLRKNDRNAYILLFNKYFEKLFTFAVHVVFREDVASDIVQELFICLYEKSDTLNYNISLKAYLFNSVRNRCFNYLRDRKVEDRRMHLYTEACIWSENMDQIDEEDVLGQVQRAMDDLPEKCREICRLRFFEGQKFEEIACSLGLSESTVRGQVAQGMDKLRRHFSPSDMAIILFFAFGAKKSNFVQTNFNVSCFRDVIKN